VEVGARPFVTVRADARQASDPTAAVFDAIRALDVSDAVVRVIVRLSESNAHLLQDGDIRQALMRAGADHVAALQKDVERPIRARLGASPERLSPEELLAHYFEAREVPPDRVDVLLAAARELFGE